MPTRRAHRARKLGRRSIRNQAINKGANLEHTSYWLDVWTIDWIRHAARGAGVSQGALLQALIMDHVMRDMTPEELAKPGLKTCRQITDMILHKIS